ncbi:MAG: flagellar hook-length control protein FliK [Clostridia bacterium]|nr:flagellar hook-length control protein FliK [Clostridia bacterium]
MTGTSAVGSQIYFFQQGSTQKLSSPNDQASSFSKTMEQTTGRSDALDRKMEDQSDTIRPKDRKDLAGLEKMKTKIENKAVDENAQEQPTDLTNAVEEAANEIKAAIMEKLGLSEEEFMSALEAMGLTMTDLLDTGNVMDLMVELTGSGDTLTLLTNEELYTDMKEIMQFVEDIKNQIQTEFGLDDTQFRELVASINEQEIPVEKQDEQITPIVKETYKENVEDETKPIVRETQGAQTESTFKAVTEIKQENPQNQTKQEHSQQNQNQFAEVTQQTTTTTNSVGDLIETVRSYTRVDGTDVMNQVTDFVKLHASADTNSLEMQLHPESLGTVNIHVTSQNGVITAQLIVQNEAVKTAMETQMLQLKDTFNEQGMKVEAVSVEIAGYDMDKDLSDNSQNGEEKKSMSRQVRRKINLADLDAISSDLSEEEQLNVEIMRENGNSVDYSA